MGDLRREPQVVMVFVLSACFVDVGGSGASQSESAGSSGTGGVTVGTSEAATTVGSGSTGVSETNAPTTAGLDVTGDETVTSSSSLSSSSGAASTTSVTTDGTSGGATTKDPSGTSETCLDLDGSCTSDGDCCGCLVCDEGSCQATSDEYCGACQTCGADSACTAKEDGAACGEGDACAGLLYGEKDGECLAYAPAIGMCQDGECMGGGCEQPGLVLQSCPGCVRDVHPCVKDGAVADVTLAAFCYLNFQPPACTQVCVEEASGSHISEKVCNSEGKCVQENFYNCGLYGCADASACWGTCSDDSYCVSSAVCFNDECVMP